MLEPTDGGAGANSYVVTNIKNLQSNWKYVLSASSAPSLQKLTAGSKLQEEFEKTASFDHTTPPPPTPPSHPVSNHVLLQINKAVKCVLSQRDAGLYADLKIVLESTKFTGP